MAQLVARVVWDHEVGGSSPLTPTSLRATAASPPEIRFWRCLKRQRVPMDIGKVGGSSPLTPTRNLLRKLELRIEIKIKN